MPAGTKRLSSICARAGGGSINVLDQLVGGLFDHDLTVATRVGRKDNLKPLEAKTWGSRAFTGKLVVLIDSTTRGANEFLARVVQLEHRGVVIGDRSSGRSVESKCHSLSLGGGALAAMPFISTQRNAARPGMGAIISSYTVSVTDADLVMSDGKSLEHVGVIPDQIILPTAADLAAGRDPMLAKAAELAGYDKLDAVAAANVFPRIWAPETTVASVLLE